MAKVYANSVENHIPDH